jgi:hypothetical protein
LRQVLIDAGHAVQIPADANPPLTGAADALHFAYAQVTGQVILTFNPKDFLALHNQTSAHPGILAVYQDNDLSRDIENLQQIQPVLADGFWILNQYQW